MEVREVDRDDQVQLRAFWEVGRDTEAAYRPYDFWVPWPTAAAYYRDGRHGFANRLLAGYVDGRMVATAQYSMPLLDNTHLADLVVRVLPAHQRRGIGTTLLERGEELARRAGRRTVLGEAYSPPGRDGPGLLFARARGYTDAIEDGVKVVDLEETETTWDALEAAIAGRWAGYRLVSWYRDVPAEHLAGFIRLNEAFNDEAPSGELQIEPEAWDERRVREAEAQARTVGRHVLAVAAVTAAGEMVGLTEIMVNEHAPQRGFQSGTLVMPAHRGHALGLAMKLANHREVRRRFPECRVLMTGNAGVNAAMNAVNERLGYREVERCVGVQKQL